MQVICVSRGSQSQGEEFASNLAAKLDYKCLGREQLLEEATRHRIPIGKLETAIIKPHTFTEKLALELEHYKALATSILCEKALKGNVVYHGRTGHLLLPGIDHIMKLRVVAEEECRIQNVMQKLQLPRPKAKRYLEQVDDDRRRWVKKFYNVEWDVFTLYDLVVNLSHVNANNAASAICNMAQLPEFQATPASIKSLRDLYLASRARLMLASDRKTSSMNVKVKANDGVIYITYPIQQANKIDTINDVLHNLKDAREIVYTKAQTNILWIQEAYNSTDNSYGNVLSLANTWDAAVELLKLAPESSEEVLVPCEEAGDEAPETWRETGIIDEGEDLGGKDASGMAKIYENLIKDGRAGGKRRIAGNQKTLLNAIDPSANYRLIIFDNAFLSKGASARKRMLQEWSNSLSDTLKIPIVSMDEIQHKYKFGPRQLVRLILSTGLTALIVFLVFNFGPQIVSFLSNSDPKSRVMAMICIVIFVPSFAFLYGSATGLFLKLIKLE